MFRLVLIGGVAGLAAGCASMFNSTSSEVAIRTNPENAVCELSGQDGYGAQVETPANPTIPHGAAPVTVSCQAPGFRRTIATLDVGSSGWIWGNSALIMATSGIAVLGLVVDEALGADWTYKKGITVDLEAERKRPVRARSRDGGQDLRLEAR